MLLCTCRVEMVCKTRTVHITPGKRIFGRRPDQPATKIGDGSLGLKKKYGDFICPRYEAIVFRQGIIFPGIAKP